MNTGDEQEWVRLRTGESARTNATRPWAADQRSVVRVLRTVRHSDENSTNPQVEASPSATENDNLQKCRVSKFVAKSHAEWRMTANRPRKDGPAKSREVDLVVFHPHYPKPLRKKRDVLASGVAAAFSVKRTLNRKEIAEAYEQAAMIRQGMKIREGTPRDHLAPPMFFGLLAESHSWTKADDPKLKVKALVEEFDKEVRTPRDGLDMLCVADLGYWVRSTSIVKGETLRSMRMPLSLAQNIPPEIAELMSGQDIVMSGLRHDYDDEDPLSPLAHLIGSPVGKASHQ